jgi:hypothetical protein
VTKSPRVLEPEAPVVLRMSHEAASPGTQGLQMRYPFPYQGAANPPALAFGKNRHRPKSVPVRGTVGHRYRGECDVPNQAPVHFSHERDRERLGGTQRGDDEVLRLTADGRVLNAATVTSAMALASALVSLLMSILSVTYLDSSLDWPTRLGRWSSLPPVGRKGGSRQSPPVPPNPGRPGPPESRLETRGMKLTCRADPCHYLLWNALRLKESAGGVMRTYRQPPPTGDAGVPGRDRGARSPSG